MGNNSLDIYGSEAKRLLKILSGRQHRCAIPCGTLFPDGTPLTLQQAQLVVARESGSESWVKFRAKTEQRDQEITVLMTDLVGILTSAFELARELGHASFTTEHMLQALLDDTSTRQCVETLGADLKLLQTQVDGVVELTEHGPEPLPDIRFQRVMQRLLMNRPSPPVPLTPFRVLGATLAEEGKKAYGLLTRARITAEAIDRYSDGL